MAVSSRVLTRVAVSAREHPKLGGEYNVTPSSLAKLLRLAGRYTSGNAEITPGTELIIGESNEGTGITTSASTLQVL